MLNLRHQRNRSWILACTSLVTLAVLFLFFGGHRGHFHPHPFHHEPHLPRYHDSDPRILRSVPTHARPPCVGARGLPLHDPKSQDLPRPTYNLTGVTYPVPEYGSYTELGLEESWMTFSQRYGPYGYGEDEDDYPLSRAKWDQVNWGKLQDHCLDPSPLSFTAQTDAPPRFRLRGDGDLQLDRSQIGKTGRQAIVIRTWSTYNYKDEDLWNLRSLITEASLATNGEYTVFLLVDYKAANGSVIHESDDLYARALDQSVPAEFRDIAVLFDVSLQKSWYEKVEEYKPLWQIMQPLQLFAYFYPEFDHYWQLEMDARFTSNAGTMLQRFHEFGTKVPYKQSRERASWTYMPQIHGTYAEFSANLNDAMQGKDPVWGPIPIVDVPHPLGRKPPTPASEDNFQFGVGDDADLLLLSPLFEVSRFNKYEDWVFKDWIRGFNQYSWDVPRFSNAPAQARAARTLLLAVHAAQHEKGLRVPSEATLPSFALWHGMKVVQIPMPKFQWPTRSLTELNFIHNGGEIHRFKDGVANGAAPYMKSIIEFYARPRTWEWQSSLVGPVFRHWMEGDKPSVVPEEDTISEDGGDSKTVPDGKTPVGSKPQNGKTVPDSPDPWTGSPVDDGKSTHAQDSPDPWTGSPVDDGKGHHVQDTEVKKVPHDTKGSTRHRRRALKPAAMGDVPETLPPFMALGPDGRVYCPGLLVHPRKTNKNP